VQNKSIYQVICNLDREGSGNITFEQFVHLNTRRLVEKDSRENIATIFSLFDDQKSGFISVQSLRRKARELGLELEDKDFQDMIAVADQDRDGFISEEEFYQFVAFPTAH
jgi:centrin-1